MISADENGVVRLKRKDRLNNDVLYWRANPAQTEGLLTFDLSEAGEFLGMELNLYTKKLGAVLTPNPLRKIGGIGNQLWFDVSHWPKARSKLQRTLAERFVDCPVDFDVSVLDRSLSIHLGTEACEFIVALSPIADFGFDQNSNLNLVFIRQLSDQFIAVFEGVYRRRGQF